MEDDDYNPADELADDDQDDDGSVEMNKRTRKPTNIKSRVDNEDEPEDDDDDDAEDEDGDDDMDEDGEDGDDDMEDITETNEAEILNRLQSNNMTNLVDTDDDDDDDMREDYLQKFDESTRQNIISNCYPELQAHNYEEIANLAVIVRDANGIPIDPLHRTIPMLTRYEKARVLGERAKQINSGAKPLVKIDENVIDGYLIALKELEEKKIPFIIKRPMPNGGCEYWKLSDLEILI